MTEKVLAIWALGLEHSEGARKATLGMGDRSQTGVLRVEIGLPSFLYQQQESFSRSKQPLLHLDHDVWKAPRVRSDTLIKKTTNRLVLPMCNYSIDSTSCRMSITQVCSTIRTLGLHKLMTSVPRCPFF